MKIFKSSEFLYKNHSIAFILTLLFIAMLVSCNATKYVPEGFYLLDKNTTKIDGEKTTSPEVTDLIIQRPNQKTFGLPLPLYFYNLGNKDYHADYQNWLKNNQRTHNFLKAVFSEKQTKRMELSNKNRNEWFLNSGEAPVVLNETKTKNSANKLRTYFFNQGYFDAEVSHETELDLKKAEVTYKITKNTPYHLDSIIPIIDSKVIDSLYNKNKKESFLNSGDRYQDINFRKEAKRLTNNFRNSGIYHFTENLIGFYDIDTTATDYKTDVILKITNRLSEKNGIITTHPLKVQKISKIGVFTDYSFSKRNLAFNDTINYRNYDFFAHEKIKYRPKALLNSIFIEPGQIYNDSARNLTRYHLKLLKNFKQVKIRYQEINDDELAATIILTPLKKYSIGVNTEAIHSNIKQIGFSGGFSFLNRNTFKGAEIFKLTFQGSIFDLANNTSTKDFNSWEVGTDASLEIPRFLLPFKTDRIIPKSMAPRTTLSLGTSFQKNIGLDRQKFTGIIDYSWQSTKTKSHKIELLNAQFVKNLNRSLYFSIFSSEYEKLENIKNTFFQNETLNTSNALDFIRNNIDNNFEQSNPEDYQTAKNIEKRYTILTTDYVSPSISYEFSYNSQSDFTDKEYSFFRAKVATSGNLTSALTKTESGDFKTFLDIPIAQFTKADFEFKKFWQTSSNTVLAFRSFLGVAIPYGNSDEIPFTNSYFIGGSNDLRAWKTYDLGPGSSNTGLEFNVSNFKFLTSLEYRFGIYQSFKGAIFVDAGNIWDITNSELTTIDEKFTGLKSLENIAIGSGFGIRYDFNFLVLRLDFGFKTYEPYLKTNKWFQNFNINNSVLNIGINYPF